MSFGERFNREIRPRSQVVPFDVSAALIYGSIRAELVRLETPLPEPDLRIASVALANGLTLVTGNVKHFQRIPGLVVENWLVEP